MNGLGIALLLVGIVLWAMFVAGCEPKPPSQSLIQYGCKDPYMDALTFASSVNGTVFHILPPTESMAPYTYPGDYEVVDMAFPFDKLGVSNFVVYQAHWLPPTAPLVNHMTAARNGDGSWVMDGINNAHYESGAQSMTRADFRGKVVRVFTTRKAP